MQKVDWRTGFHRRYIASQENQITNVEGNTCERLVRCKIIIQAYYLDEPPKGRAVIQPVPFGSPLTKLNCYNANAYMLFHANAHAHVGDRRIYIYKQVYRIYICRYM